MSATKFASLRGMKDLLPETYQIHQHIIEAAKKISKLYDYQGIETPILEHATIFDRTLGDDSDIVSKELYCFPDKKGRLIAMRPEFTASIMRAIFSNNLVQKLPLKLFSTGPIFRYDRPQEGRQRQFHQLNFEYLQADEPHHDAEIIATAAHLLEELKVNNDVTLELNSLGCDETRNNYQSALTDYFAQYTNELSIDSQRRLTNKNPLRILDSKDQSDQKIIANAPIITNFYTKTAAKYFDQVKYYLTLLNIHFVENHRLVRGLDYYSHTSFEFITNKLGAQATILAGGRYDKLAKIIGGTDIASIGFAAGIERIALMRDFPTNQTYPCYILPINDHGYDYAIKLAQSLRKKNIATQLMSKGKISKRLQKIAATSAQYVIFIGEGEIEENKCRVKNLRDQTELDVSIDSLAEFLCNKTN